MSIQFASETSQKLLGEMVGGTEQGGMIMAAMGMGAQYGLQLPYSRAHETEADLLGLRLMARAGFDPRASVVLWRNMAKVSKGAPPEFLSTHPANQTRIANLEANMAGAMSDYRLAQQRGRRPACH